jgi:hypothetical protein
MSKPVSPARMSLNVAAGKVEADTLTIEERKGLAKILRALADGKSINEIFEIKIPSHRPRSWVLEQRIQEVAVLMLPVVHGGEKLTKQKAIEKVARLHHVEIGTIDDDYKSARGKAVRAQVKATYFNPLTPI